MEKHCDMEGKGNGVGHQHGRKPRIPEPVLISLETHLVRGHWTSTGAEPTEQWMDKWDDGVVRSLPKLPLVQESLSNADTS